MSRRFLPVITAAACLAFGLTVSRPAAGQG